MLKVDNINVSYGKIEVLHGVSLEIKEGELVTVIGANGAGKSTLMKTIMGLLKPTSGKIIFNDEEIQGMKTHKIVTNGVILVPEGRRIFPKLTVFENIEMGAYNKAVNKSKFKENVEKIYNIFPRLKERERQLGGTLSGGEQQMLAIARAIMSEPKVLMLDEPSLGLAPVIMDELFDLIQRINKEQKIPVLLVEQNAFSALEISDKAYVLELGRVFKEGLSSELLNDNDIIKAYLGGN